MHTNHTGNHYYAIAKECASLINSDKLNFSETQHIYKIILNCTNETEDGFTLDLNKFLLSTNTNTTNDTNDTNKQTYMKIFQSQGLKYK